MRIDSLSKFITRLKGTDNEYKIDRDLNFSDLVGIIFTRGMQFLRGTFIKVRLKSKGLIFSGKHVIVKSGSNIITGKNLILSDNVYIDGLSRRGIRIGENVTILNNATIQSTAVIRNLGEGIEIGDDSAIGAYNFLSGQGGIKIGKQVIIGPYVKIFSENHNFSDLDTPIKYQGEQRAEVTINDNCWIGAGSIILAGVNIPKGTVVGAGSIVTKSIEKENMIIAGTPAKIIKSREV